MIKLNDDLLQELGLAGLPLEEKKRLLAHIYETLEMRVGMKLAQQMTDEQLDEFEQFIKANDEAGALNWLETKFPHYKDVVSAEFETLKGEIRQVAPQILASSTSGHAQQPGMAQPQMPYGAQQQPMQPGQPMAAPQPQQAWPQPQPQQQAYQQPQPHTAGAQQQAWPAQPMQQPYPAQPAAPVQSSYGYAPQPQQQQPTPQASQVPGASTGPMPSPQPQPYQQPQPQQPRSAAPWSDDDQQNPAARPSQPSQQPPQAA